MDFLKNAPGGGVPNRIVVTPLKKGSKSFKFHPFIEDFRHNISPQIQQQKFGLFSVSTYFRNGISDNQYSVTLVFPAVDAAHAKRNFKTVQRFKKLATPSLAALTSDTGLVKMSIGQLMPARVGYIMSVDESFDFDVGFAAGYPKLIKLSFTFAVDELREELYGKKETSGSTVGKQNQPANKKTNQTMAERKKSVDIKIDMQGGKHPTKQELEAAQAVADQMAADRRKCLLKNGGN